MAVSQPITGFAHVSGPAGGWMQITELHSDGLVTSEFSSRKTIGRLSENVPTVEDGTLSILPDGRMSALFHLRKGVTWHDGAPFTAHDVAFSYKVALAGGIPPGFTGFMDSVEAQDDSTVVVYYKAPFYLGTKLGPHAFWPVPQHILGAPYERLMATGNLVDFLQLPYWNEEYVHLGPFRLTSFDPGQGLRFEANNAYFLGRPKIDVIELRVFTDQGTLLSNLMAGTVHISPAHGLLEESAREAKRRWDSSGDGRVYALEGVLRILLPQLQPWAFEPTLRDPRVRKAMLHGLDKVELSDVLSVTPAWSMLPESDSLYPAVKDGLRQFNYDPARAHALLSDVGWSLAPDQTLRNRADGHQFRHAIWGTPGRDQETALYASYWRALGMDVEEQVIAPALYRDPAYIRQYPGFNMTGSDPLDVLRNPAGGPHNNWQGNTNGWEDPVARRLVDALTTTIVEREQLQAWKAIDDYIIAELPMLPIYRGVVYTAANKRVKAFDDMAGAGGERIPPWYGGYARNAYLWDFHD